LLESKIHDLSQRRLHAVRAPRCLFDDVTTQFGGRRYGLTGPNGAGKSTFMKLLTGEIEPQRGTVVRPPKVGVLRQDQFAFDQYRVIDTVVMGNQRLWTALAERDALYAKADMSNEEGMRLGELEGIVGEEDGYTAESDAAILLQGSTFPTRSTSGRWASCRAARRSAVLLAQALYGHPAALLPRRADEPPGPRLDPLARGLSRPLRRHAHRHLARPPLPEQRLHAHRDIDYETIITYTGGYDDMVVAKTQIRTTLEAQNEQREKKIAQLNDFIARFSAGTRSSQVQSRRKEVSGCRRPSSRDPTSSVRTSSSR
jgi:ATPase subunit of ABC transporter with duplicated ATPase domains